MTKCLYLKELTVSSVRASIERLPLTTEGYQRAKKIIQTKYGKISDIVISQVQYIMQLPVAFGKNLVKIREFFKKLVTHVQTLETMGKLEEINGIICLLFDQKLNLFSVTITGKNGVSKDLSKTGEKGQRKIMCYLEARRLAFILEMKGYYKEASHKVIDCKKVTYINKHKRTAV